MSYTPTEWQTGDTITAEKLNNMENGIDNANHPFVITLTPTAADLSGTMNVEPDAVDAAARNRDRIVFSIPALGGEVEATQYLINAGTGLVTAHANIVFNPGTGDALVHIATSPTSSTYQVAMFPLTPMS